MKVFVAGKISGISKAKVLTKFKKAKKKLLKQNHEVLIPTILPSEKELKSFTHEDYLHICQGMIDVCDAVYMLKDWQSSTEAREERSYALEWRKVILYEDESTKE